MLLVNTRGMSRDALIQFRQSLAEQIRHVDGELATTDPHGIQLTIKTTTEEPDCVAALLNVAEQVVANSSGKNFDIGIIEQTHSKATMWESRTIAELRAKYNI